MAETPKPPNRPDPCPRRGRNPSPQPPPRSGEGGRICSPPRFGEGAGEGLRGPAPPPNPLREPGRGGPDGLPSPLRGGAGGGVSSRGRVAPPPPARNIVIGQRVDEAKVIRAKELRRAMTPEERLLWERLRANRLAGFHFRRHQPIDGFIVDFYCHSVALIVEVDGPIHDEQVDADAQRDDILKEHGFRIVRFRNEQVRDDLPNVLRQIERLCREQ